jgi:hypothetical protein
LNRTAALVAGCFFAASFAAYAADEEYRVYGDHPRLMVNAQHLRLLKRERDRDSMRWRQFSLMVRAASEMPEPGFDLGLYYVVTGDDSIGKRVADWAVNSGTDLRQLAFAYDWCQTALGPARSKALAAKIRKLLEERPAQTLAERRDRVLAAVAIADDAHLEAPILKDTVEQWWREQTVPALVGGKFVPGLDELYALFELMHVVRDNLKIELRDDAPDYFRSLPTYQVLGNYPAPLDMPENQYRVPVYAGSGLPSVDRSTIARAAGLASVAYDNNDLGNQFLQGWLIQDRYMLQGTLGAPYEFFWANPYQPGLSYFQLPVLFHDPASGTLFVRSNWEDEAVWFGLYKGEAQLFDNGEITVLNKTPPASDEPKTVPIGDVTVVLGRLPIKCPMPGDIVVIGLKPQSEYIVEIDDEEMQEMNTDTAGTLLVGAPHDHTAGMRVYQADGSAAGE